MFPVVSKCVKCRIACHTKLAIICKEYLKLTPVVPISCVPGTTKTVVFNEQALMVHTVLVVVHIDHFCAAS